MANENNFNPSVPSQVVAEVKFPKFINNLGIIPTSYKDSMSYYECLAWLCKFLEEQVIPTVNENGEAVEELQTLYVTLKDYLLNAQAQYELNLTTNVNNKIQTLENFMNNYFDNLDVQNEIDNKIDDLIESGDFPEIILDHLGNKLNNYSDSNIASLGEELLTDSSLWDMNDGWTGSFTNGFTHIVGESANLEYNYSFEADKFYYLTFNVTSSSGQGENASCALTVQIGNSGKPILYRGGGSYTYKIGIKPTQAGILKFIPCDPSDQYTSSTIFNGTVWDISLKEVTDQLEQLSIIDENDDDSLSFTITPKASKNVAIGNNTLLNSVSADSNVFVGDSSGQDTVAGFYNVGVGYNTLKFNVQGSRNIAIGFNALQNNVSADRNIAIGAFCMNDNIEGRKNIAIGFDTLQHLTSGENNIGIGNQTFASSSATTVSNNMAIGNQAMSQGTITGSHNIAIGTLSAAKITSGNNNIGLGRLSNYKLTTGINNIAIGNSALNLNETGGRTIAIGTSCLSGFTTGDFNVAIGTNNSTTLATMNYGVLIGCNNVTNLDGMTNSIILGSNVTGSSSHKTLTDVVVINSGSEQLNSVNDHRTIISKSIYIDTSGTRKKVGIQKESPTARLHIPGATTDANTAPLKIDSGSLMTTPEDGAFEYDGSHLYFTIGSTRKQLD